MASQPITIRIPDDQLLAIETKAKTENVKRQVILKMAIARFVESQQLNT